MGGKLGTAASLKGVSIETVDQQKEQQARQGCNEPDENPRRKWTVLRPSAFWRRYLKRF